MKNIPEILAEYILKKFPENSILVEIEVDDECLCGSIDISYKTTGTGTINENDGTIDRHTEVLFLNINDLVLLDRYGYMIEIKQSIEEIRKEVLEYLKKRI